MKLQPVERIEALTIINMHRITIIHFTSTMSDTICTIRY